MNTFLKSPEQKTDGKNPTKAKPVRKRRKKTPVVDDSPLILHARYSWDSRNDYRQARKQYGELWIEELHDGGRVSYWQTAQRDRAMKAFAKRDCRIYQIKTNGEFELIFSNDTGSKVEKS